jgi:Domain of unknown function (DUF4129)
MLGRIWQRSNWINDAVLPLLGALTWSAWGGVLLAALLDFVTDHQANLNTGPAVLLLLLGGTLAGRLASRQPRGWWIILLGGLAATLLAEWWLLFWPAYAPWNLGWVYSLAVQVTQVAPGPFLVAISAALAWRHGAIAEWTSHAEMTFAFVSGVLVLGVALFIAASFSPATVSQLTLAVVQLLLAAWAALSLAGVADASHSVSGDQPLQLNRYWLVAALTVVGVIFGLGLLLTSFVTPDTVRGWAALFEPIANLVRLGVWYLFYGASYLIFLVLTPLIDWLRSLMGQSNPQPARPFSPFDNQPPGPGDAAVVLPPALELILRGLTIVGFLVLVGFIVAWALRRKADTDQAGVRENRDLIWSWDLVKEQLAELLARRSPAAAFTALAGDLDDPLTWVRRAYQRLLALALARGRARPPRQTPQAFLPTLSEIWPGETRNLAELTAAYTAARYGQVPPSAEQLAALKTAMERLAAAEPRAAAEARQP